MNTDHLAAALMVSRHPLGALGVSLVSGACAVRELTRGRIGSAAGLATLSALAGVSGWARMVALALAAVVWRATTPEVGATRPEGR